MAEIQYIRFCYPFYPITSDYFVRVFRMIHDSDQPIIPIEINSPGGYAVSLADILDCCESSEKPIATFSTGMAASCGAALAMAGDNGLRFIGPNAHFLLHQASGFAWGKAADIEAEAKLLNKLVDKFVYQKCDKAANKKEGYTKNLIKQNFNADLSFMGQEAVDAGFFNQVGTISMLKNIDDLLFKWKQANIESEPEEDPEVEPNEEIV